MKNLIRNILIFSFIAILVASCNRTSNKSNYKGRIISKTKMIHFLIDLHKTDEILKSYDLSDRNLSTHDSLSYYNYLLKKYKINYSDFERSLAYYFSNTEQFYQMYNIVLDSIRKEHNILDSSQLGNRKNKNLWRGRQYYLIPFHDYTEDSIPFRIKYPKPGKYILTAEIAVYNDDQTYNFHMLMYAKYANGLVDSVKKRIFLKDSKFHKYTLKINLTDTVQPVELGGNLLAYTKTIYMHVKVRNIWLTRQPILDLNRLLKKHKKKNQ